MSTKARALAFRVIQSQVGLLLLPLTYDGRNFLRYFLPKDRELTITGTFRLLTGGEFAYLCSEMAIDGLEWST